MSAAPQPSRVLLVTAGLMTQLVGASCLVLALASLPVIHDLHGGLGSIVASIVASIATVICGTLVYRGRLVPLALAAGLDVGFGIGLPRGTSALSAALRMLPREDAATSDTLITAAAIFMFVAALMCIVAVPSALALRRWARTELERAATAPRPSGGDLNKPVATLRGFGPGKLVPTQVIRIAPRAKPAIIIGVSVSLIAIGIVAISSTRSTDLDKDDTRAANDPAAQVKPIAATRDGGVTLVAIEADAAVAPAAGDAALAEPKLEDLAARLHAALVHATAADLGSLLDDHVFAFGVEAHDVAEGRDAVVAMLRKNLGAATSRGFEVAAKFSQLGHAGDIGWLAEEVRVGTKSFVVTAVAGLRDGAWSIAALQWATAMANETAYKLARDSELAIPDAIPDNHDASPLAVAMRTGFASKPSFVAARSTRNDAFNFGSAPGERILGGETIKKMFSRIRATIRLHDAVKVGSVGERGGWGAANVEFTDTDRDGNEVTQTFRVLVAWLQEDAGWRMVQTQWSNAR